LKAGDNAFWSKKNYFCLYQRIKIGDDEHLIQQADRPQKYTDQFSSKLIPPSILPPSSPFI
jgi:hypothetical protein